MKTILYSLFISLACMLVLACKKSNVVSVTPSMPVPVVTVYEFEKDPVWQDEFDIDGLPDANKWNYDEGGSGWGNNELQYYTKSRSENARAENGKLIIETIKEDFSGKKYTSARLVTKRKGDWLYGKFVIRAKIPEGRGTWPAIWMLATDTNYGTNYWPDNGEIDIMEHVGFDPNRIHGNIHTKAYNHAIQTNKGNNVVIPTATSEYHTYTTEWTPVSIKILIDDNPYFEFKNEGTWQKWPFDKKFHLLLNIAVGGNWGGQKGVDDAIFPKRMEVDYVRVYALKKN
ncbi:MAG: glycoside hydrolase family 16 protein [Verrucomicrobia bacterium]|nr:glycoside hydrolase family 16 protein [Cytophagales bacterium]